METKIQEILQEPVMPKVLKVAAYARVSTSEEDQQHSYQSQEIGRASCRERV